jgi:hypothetical protein
MGLVVSIYYSWGERYALQFQDYYVYMCKTFLAIKFEVVHVKTSTIVALTGLSKTSLGIQN